MSARLDGPRMNSRMYRAFSFTLPLTGNWHDAIRSPCLGRGASGETGRSAMTRRLADRRPRARRGRPAHTQRCPPGDGGFGTALDGVHSFQSGISSVALGSRSNTSVFVVLFPAGCVIEASQSSALTAWA